MGLIYIYRRWGCDKKRKSFKINEMGEGFNRLFGFLLIYIFSAAPGKQLTK